MGDHKFIRTEAGFYHIFAMANWKSISLAGGDMSLSIHKSNTSEVARVTDRLPTSASTTKFVSAVFHLNGSSDYVHIRVLNNGTKSDSNPRMNNIGAQHRTRVDAYKIN